MLPGIQGAMAGIGAGQAIQLVVNGTPQSDNTNLTTYTFTIDIGAAAATRRVFVGFHWIEGSAHRTFVDGSINSVGQDTNSSSGHNGGVTGLGAGLMSALVPTGSGNVTVEIEMSGVCDSMAINHVVAYGMPDDTVRHASDSDRTQGTASDLDCDVDTLAGGFVIGVYTGSTGIAGESVTWTGATEIYDAVAGNGRGSMAVLGNLNAAVGYDVDVDMDGGPQADAGNDMVVESWGIS